MVSWMWIHSRHAIGLDNAYKIIQIEIRNVSGGFRCCGAGSTCESPMYYFTMHIVYSLQHNV